MAASVAAGADGDGDPPLRLCLASAFAAAGLGLALRLALPVAPADEPYREVVRFYRSLPQTVPGLGGGHRSNTGETPMPY